MTEHSDSTWIGWVRDVQQWFAEFVPANESHEIAAAWDQFAASAVPVLTVFGAYDSGKSSLLRRLLVDEGVDCPDWLTISARHETFDVAMVEVTGIMVRDTPGLSPEADDPRGAQNNQRAFSAAGLTDALLVVLPPQLATGELDMLREVVDQVWELGSLRFAVSRFDEAGVDPSGDLEQYEALAARKVEELKQELNLPKEVPVNVVAPDAWQLAGDLRQPAPSTWDDCRSWDGMLQLREGLSQLPEQMTALRIAASVRYWSAAMRKAADDLAVQLQQTRQALTTGGQTANRVGQLKDRLAELRSARRAELDGSLTSLLDQALTAGTDDQAQLRERMETVLRDWYETSMAELSHFSQDAEAEFERQIHRPGWQNLDEVLRGLPRERGGESAGSTADDGEIAPTSNKTKTRLLELNTSLSKAVQEVKTVFSKRIRDFSPTASAKTALGATSTRELAGAADHAVLAGEVLVAVGPTLVEVFSFVSDLQRERRQQDAEKRTREQIEKRMSELRDSLEAVAFAAFAGSVNSLQGQLKEIADSVAGMDQSLSARLGMLQQAGASADHLLQDIAERNRRAGAERSA